ncbi:hypothetical protein DQ04_06631040 [Trypanosoma grayi]|uniref:hypothetical protein n=1 Tax=Trypanosoma grayi TaxID=71804 RepID=UPI0004F410F5|nr:hypothetical protein DQ04_06631040 [Trypanosoma grayi]KEG08693.1 hypothetical protein DQ04_06631040 [Trypanosoma grayi]
MPHVTYGVCGGVSGGFAFSPLFLLENGAQKAAAPQRRAVRGPRPGSPTPFALKVGQEGRDTLLQNNPVNPPRALPTPGALVPEASLCGWGALLFKGNGGVWPQGVRGKKPPI